MARRLELRLAQLAAKDLANVAWALGKVEAPPELVGVLGRRALDLALAQAALILQDTFSCAAAAAPEECEFDEGAGEAMRACDLARLLWGLHKVAALREAPPEKLALLAAALAKLVALQGASLCNFANATVALAAAGCRLANQCRQAKRFAKCYCSSDFNHMSENMFCLQRRRFAADRQAATSFKRHTAPRTAGAGGPHLVVFRRADGENERRGGCPAAFHLRPRVAGTGRAEHDEPVFGAVGNRGGRRRAFLREPAAVGFALFFIIMISQSFKQTETDCHC